MGLRVSGKTIFCPVLAILGLGEDMAAITYADMLKRVCKLGDPIVSVVLEISVAKEVVTETLA